MEKRKLYKISLITFVIGLVILLITYFCFHYVTDEGITLVWHEEAGKPFVTFLLGMFGVLFIWSSVISLLISIVFCSKED
jgi:H+/Cl- antiporter ClcA